MSYCSLSAFVILLCYTEMPKEYGEGMGVVISAFSSVFGRGAEIIISVSVFFFAFATIICWAYYGESCIRYLKKIKNPTLFYFFFCSSLFFGSLLAPSFVWGITDVIISLMTVINVCALITKADRVKTLSAEFGLLDIKIKERECERKTQHPMSKDASPCH